MPLAPGSNIGQYKVISPLGAGGMGEVYLAQDQRLRRKVALKLLFQDVTRNEDWVRRFEQEAYAASALNHPNIITIYEVGQVGDSHFISTEFIEGRTLRERLSTESLSLSETLDIAIQVATALVAAHSAGIIHRDIKPENVMLRSDGYVKVLDFGLAKFTEKPYRSAHSDPDADTRVHTSPGVVMGTVSYMSPEQARGNDVDERTDIFSLGVLLYEMLSGRLPFEGNTPNDVIVSIIGKRPPSLARFTPEISPELERIVAKSLAKKRDDRYQTLKDMLIDLKRFKRQLEADDEEFDTTTEPAAKQYSDSDRMAKTVTGAQEVLKTQPIVQPQASSAEYIVNGIKRHKKAVLIAAVVTLAAIIGLTTYILRRPMDSIAVLPFQSDATDAVAEQVAEDIAQNVINGLAQASGLRVMSFNSVQRYKGRAVDPQAVGREMSVRTVLTGRIFKRDKYIIVSVELIDARDRSLLWGLQKPVKPEDSSLVREEIVAAVSNTIGVKLTAEEKRKREAETLYIKGRNAWNKRTTDGLNEAVNYFNQALEHNPNYALAHAGLADCYNMLATYGARAPTDAFPKAHDAAIKALAIDPNLAEGHAALAYTTFRGDWKWQEAEYEFKRAISLNEQYATAHQWYANFLAARGRFEESISETRRTQEIEKTSPIINAQWGLVYYLAHRFDDAIAEVKKTDPSFFAARRYLGLAYAQKGMYKEAIEEFQKAIEASGGSPLIRAEYANALALSGDTARAQSELNSLIELSRQKYISAYHIAAIYVGLKDKDSAFKWLDKAYQDRADWMAFLKVDARFDSLHSDPRFDELLRRMNL